MLKGLIAELGIYPLETPRGARKLKWQYKVRNTLKKRLPAKVDGTVSEEVTKGQAGIRWDSVVEKAWKDIGGNHEETMSVENFGRHKAEVEEMIERRETLALRNKVESGIHLEIYGGLSEGI